MSISVNNKAEAKIRQLCSLGLKSNEVMPKLLKLIHQCIPAYANAYCWVDKSGNLFDLYDERLISHRLLPTYLEDYPVELERQVFDGWASTFHHRNTVDMDRLWKVDRKEFKRHSFYNDLFRHIGYHHGLHRPIRKNGKYHGYFQLHRSSSDGPFSNADCLALDRIARHVEYSISVPSSEPCSGFRVTSGIGLVIVELSGEILHFSGLAERLLLLAGCGKAECRARCHNFSSCSSSPLVKLIIERLLGMATGKDVEQPSFNVVNKWGTFRLIGYFMKPVEEGPSAPLAIIEIQHLEPSMLALLEKLEDQKLTDRQKDVSLLIGKGQSYQEIADTLGIAVSTVISHKKDVFRKLEIRHRHELVEQVLYQ